MALRELLRNGTQTAHRAIEGRIAFDATQWPLERYQRYLRRMHAFHRDAEALLDCEPVLRGAGLEMERRRKVPWLARDLEWFGLAPIDAACGVDGRAMRGARAIGWAYVLEGATLGGRVLYRDAAARWSLGRERGAAYLYGYGEETSRMWSAFTHALDALPIDAAQAGEAVRGANDAFAALEDWFGENAWREGMRATR